MKLIWTFKLLIVFTELLGYIQVKLKDEGFFASLLPFPSVFC